MLPEGSPSAPVSHTYVLQEDLLPPKLTTEGPRGLGQQMSPWGHVQTGLRTRGMHFCLNTSQPKALLGGALCYRTYSKWLLCSLSLYAQRP